MNDTRILLETLINSGLLNQDDLIDFASYSHRESASRAEILVADYLHYAIAKEEAGIYPQTQLIDGLLYHEANKRRLGLPYDFNK